ncbi:hypothetical protein Y032_0132g1699 [Ancylostoma ceylanicum]|nr:hypothetical protein Y032_0132g1699 [Ancylostoma ceylanicum]
MAATPARDIETLDAGRAPTGTDPGTIGTPSQNSMGTIVIVLSFLAVFSSWFLINCTRKLRGTLAKVIVFLSV